MAGKSLTNVLFVLSLHEISEIAVFTKFQSLFVCVFHKRKIGNFPENRNSGVCVAVVMSLL